MKLRLLDFLVCPIDKAPLELVEWESYQEKLSEYEVSRAERLGISPHQLSKEIESGLLLNRARRIFYPIYKGVPRLLIFPTSVSPAFLRRYGKRIEREWPGFKLPGLRPMPGEKDVLRTFSSEWASYDWDGNSYWNMNPHAIYKCMRFMLDLDHKPLKDKLVLEVGIGIGGTADYLSRNEECEMVGVDLSYAVDGAYKYFGKNKFLHIVQASLFALPFRDEGFDFVFSHGVLHHTFSTKEAFEHICKLPKMGGELQVWVYGAYEQRRNWIRQVLAVLENIIRPMCWRLPERLQTALLLPLIPLYLIHQNVFVRRKGHSYIKYGWSKAIHAARDRFTPRFAHRHTDQEVCAWFNAAGYTILQGADGHKYPDFIPPSFATGVGVRGVRGSE